MHDLFALVFVASEKLLLASRYKKSLEGFTRRANTCRLPSWVIQNFVNPNVVAHDRKVADIFAVVGSDGKSRLVLPNLGEGHTTTANTTIKTLADYILDVEGV